MKHHPHKRLIKMTYLTYRYPNKTSPIHKTFYPFQTPVSPRTKPTVCSCSIFWLLFSWKCVSCSHSFISSSPLIMGTGRSSTSLYCCESLRRRNNTQIHRTCQKRCREVQHCSQLPQFRNRSEALSLTTQTSGWNTVFRRSVSLWQAGKPSAPQKMDSRKCGRWGLSETGVADPCQIATNKTGQKPLLQAYVGLRVHCSNIN